MTYSVVSLLTDYGRADERVGVLHSVIIDNAEAVRIVDIGHETKPGDVRAAAMQLVRAGEYMCPGVVVVDVQVSTTDVMAPRHVAVSVGDGHSVLIGPDNGVLAPVVALVGGASGAVQLPKTRSWFVGRDLYATAAAQLANGAELTSVGTPVDVNQLRPGVLPIAAVEHGSLRADVVHVDNRGAVQLNATPEQLQQLPDKLVLRTTNGAVAACKAELDDIAHPQSGVKLITDAAGLVSIIAPPATPAAQLIGVAVWDSVTVGPAVEVSPG